MLVIAVIGTMALAVVGAAGFMLGCRYTAQEVVDRLKNDPETGLAMLETLANRYGAKLEMFKGMGAGTAPDDKGPAR